MKNKNDLGFSDEHVIDGPDFARYMCFLHFHISCSDQLSPCAYGSVWALEVLGPGKH